MEMKLSRIYIPGILNGSHVPLSKILPNGGKIVRVWTVLSLGGLLTQFNPQTGEPEEVGFEDCTPRHRQTAWLEDHLHDWCICWREGVEVFRFFGHSGFAGDSHDLLVEFEP